MADISLPKNILTYKVNHDTRNDFESNSLNYVFKNDPNKKTLLDLSYIDTQYGIKLLQTIFIDNTNNDGTVIIECIETGQLIKCPPNKQGYFPIMTYNKPKFYLYHNGTSAVNIPLFFLNFIIAGVIW